MQPITSIEQCSLEPIHMPGHIQPHGILFALDAELKITHVSQNVAQWWNGKDIDALYGVPMTDLLTTRVARDLRTHLLDPAIADYNPLRVQFSQGDFDLIGNRSGDHLILELEKVTSQGIHVTLSPYHTVRHAVAQMRQSDGLHGLSSVVAAEIKRVTGYARVMIYRFHENWDGEVVVENCDDDVQSFGGLRFPASDIPAQARELYTRLTQRIIPDVNYEPVKVCHSADTKPLDLSMSVLRSVSPFHLQYMKNMGVRASMSISIVRDGQLWGLISCADEHKTRYVPFDIRASCDFLSENMSLLIESKEAKGRSQARHRANKQTARLLRQMVNSDYFVDGLLRQKFSMADLISAGGAAVIHGSEAALVGKTPNREQVMKLAEWLLTAKKGPIWATQHLHEAFAPASEYKDTACGLLCGFISASRGEMALWFRPETQQVIHWGGNPRKEEAFVNGQLSPRTSFQRWTETVTGRSLAWSEEDRSTAGDLLRSIIDIVLQSSEELSALNSELERSNLELDAFAYAASHDLKEPLRGINNFTAFAQRDLPQDSSFDGTRDKLSVVVRLTHRMEALIDALLRYSHLGRTDVEMTPVDLNDVVASTVEMLQIRIKKANARVHADPALPVVLGNKTLLQELVTNLVTNALKYNDKDVPEVMIKAAREGSMVKVSVRDNGIGIPTKNQKDVFKIFRRLHERQAYGGGTGTGLTIASRIAERHGGRLWLASAPKAGSTFYFSLRGSDERGTSDTRRGGQ